MNDVERQREVAAYDAHIRGEIVIEVDPNGVINELPPDRIWGAPTMGWRHYIRHLPTLSLSGKILPGWTDLPKACRKIK